MATRGEKARNRAIEILKNSPQGKRYSELLTEIHETFPEFPKNTIVGAIWNLDATRSNEVYKPARGLFRHINYSEEKVEIIEDSENNGNEYIKETNFYNSFADYLRNDLQECTNSIVLGSNYFKDKWQTPDIMGINKSKQTDIIKHEDEFISAEIKTNFSTQALITAFGQACAYQLFSHKVYIVIPEKAPEWVKIESLCLIFGIGLILFDATNPEKPNWQIKTRALKREPDWFYVNQYIPLIADKLYNEK